MPDKTFREIPLRDLSPEKLEDLSKMMKLSLSREDMVAVQAYFEREEREPTDVELEVIAQTWSEHCKHRIFSALIRHSRDGREETVDGLFRTCVKQVTDAIRESKPGFVLAAFDDNAGFVRLDGEWAACLKVETHNHPSAIEPYAGANTGLGGVIRDILGAGLGATPIASLDVFCFGRPDTRSADLKAKDVIHPLGVMRGVVRGVRDYGNRMGIPTVAGAIQFDDAYTYNPLVYCGTAGVIRHEDIEKEVTAGQLVVAVGGRTGRDGLHGATFSSASLTTDSHEEDQQAVQIGNPIEEKKVHDFTLQARDEKLIGFVTDCGAGGFSSAAGEMLSEVGGEIFLERAPLKEPGLVSWEIFLSESQERMVYAVDEKNLTRLEKLAAMYETELTVLGKADGSGVLKVWHNDQAVCQLECSRLHDAPRREMSSRWETPVFVRPGDFADLDFADALKELLADFAVVSRAPVIREYDHEVQGNTMLKPLAGATGDAPQDGSVLRVDGSEAMVAMSLSLLPEWGKTDPRAMGMACVDECVRQLVVTGADPDRIALLDNFCMGNPEDETELGALVESAQGMAEIATAYGAPFVSGKDSFYNYFETDEGPVSVPVTLLISGMGVVENAGRITGSSIRGEDSVVFWLGSPQAALGGSVFARHYANGALWEVPGVVDSKAALQLYRCYADAVGRGLVRAAHDVSEGGLLVALAEMGFSLRAGLDIDWPDSGVSDVECAFGEGPAQILVEVSADKADAFSRIFNDSICRRIGTTTDGHCNLRVAALGIDESLTELKKLWQNGLGQYY